MKISKNMAIALWIAIPSLIIGSIAIWHFSLKKKSAKGNDVDSNKPKKEDETVRPSNEKYQLAQGSLTKYPAGVAFLYNGVNDVTQTSIYPARTTFRLTGKKETVNGIVLLETELKNAKDQRNIYVLEGAIEKVA